MSISGQITNLIVHMLFILNIYIQSFYAFVLYFLRVRSLKNFYTDCIKLPYKLFEEYSSFFSIYRIFK